jgi:hypothetical protein
MSKVPEDKIIYLRQKGTNKVFTLIRYDDPKENMRKNPLLERVTMFEEDMVIIDKKEALEWVARNEAKVRPAANPLPSEKISVLPSDLAALTKKQLLAVIDLEKLDIVVKPTMKVAEIIEAINAARQGKPIPATEELPVDEPAAEPAAVP